MSSISSRRRFIRNSMLGTLGLAGGFRFSSDACAQAQAQQPKPPRGSIWTPTHTPVEVPPARVALTAGDSRADNTFRALRQFEKEIAQAIGDKLVVLKPNMVMIDQPTCATHADQLEGILEFLKSIRKTNVVIAESPGGGSTLEGYDNYGYTKFAGKYGVKLVELDKMGFDTVYCMDQSDMCPHPCRVSKMMTDPNSFIISAAKFKTHGLVGATFSLKNVVVGAGFKESNGKSDKMIMHGGGPHGINYNIAALAPRLHPHLAVIDGFEGMEGNGPVGGAMVDHRVCVVGLDWLAADTVCAELIGMGIGKIGYLTYAARAGLGQADLSKIEILGPALKDHIKIYKEPSYMQQALSWQKPFQPA